MRATRMLRGHCRVEWILSNAGRDLSDAWVDVHSGRGGSTARSDMCPMRKRPHRPTALSLLCRGGWRGAGCRWFLCASRYARDVEFQLELDRALYGGRARHTAAMCT